MLPLTDLFDGVPRGHPSANVELVDGRPRAMWARATRSVTPGEPLLLDCGPASSAAFAAQYGAVPPGFPCAGGRTNLREVVALRPPRGGAGGHSPLRARAIASLLADPALSPPPPSTLDADDDGSAAASALAAVVKGRTSVRSSFPPLLLSSSHRTSDASMESNRAAIYACTLGSAS